MFLVETGEYRCHCIAHRCHREHLQYTSRQSYLNREKKKKLNLEQVIRIIKEMNSFIFPKDADGSETKAAGDMNAVHKCSRE